jgi:hypothetical protein
VVTAGCSAVFHHIFCCVTLFEQAIAHPCLTSSASLEVVAHPAHPFCRVCVVGLQERFKDSVLGRVKVPVMDVANSGRIKKM